LFMTHNIKKLINNGNIAFLHLRLFMWPTDCSRWSVQTLIQPNKICRYTIMQYMKS
jgi:hypothetical protein